MYIYDLWLWFIFDVLWEFKKEGSKLCEMFFMFECFLVIFD